MTIRNFGNDRLNHKWVLTIAVSLFVLVGTMSDVFAHNTDANNNLTYRDMAKRIHDRLIGVPPMDEVLNVMANYIDPSVDGAVSGGPNQVSQPVEAALYAMEPAADAANGNPRAWLFYTVSLKNWITPWTNEAQTMFAPLNDYTTTVIGMILNDDPFYEVLTGSYIYTGNVSAINSAYSMSLPGYSRTNNNHYEQMENNYVDLSSYLIKEEQSSYLIAGSPADSAGVTTTRAAGEAYFKAGTNRRMLRFTLKNFMCRDLEDVKDITRVPDRIRQDVSRSPGGDSTLFLNSCIGCHSGMDPLASAYAYYEWTEDENGNNGQVVYSNGLFVQPKYHINRTNFEYGFVTQNNSWSNYWRQGPNAALEWDWGSVPTPPTGSGSGAKSLGREIANSHAFAQCQVEKVYKQVCLQDPISTHATDLEAITLEFKNNGYRMKRVFARVAELCMGN